MESRAIERITHEQLIRDIQAAGGRDVAEMNDSVGRKYRRREAGGDRSADLEEKRTSLSRKRNMTFWKRNEKGANTRG